MSSSSFRASRERGLGELSELLDELSGDMRERSILKSFSNEFSCVVVCGSCWSRTATKKKRTLYVCSPDTNQRSSKSGDPSAGESVTLSLVQQVGQANRVIDSSKTVTFVRCDATAQKP
mmetsp:Transcript_22036/g.55311  ORF Transcript_22036/g.55311 Transcript_22036/m.55311 type:complete len:119 (+) Transcript_22036:1326-1682(+)